jgi:hypothetical protein
MDPIRPIGPVERDLSPVERVTRLSPDGRREGREREEPPPRRPRPTAPQPAAPPEDEGGPSLIDIKV